MILTNSGVLKLMQRIKSFITAQLNTKAASVHTHSISEIDNLESQLGGGYSKSEVDTLLTGKADTSHTHTKSQITDFPSYGTTANTICEGNDSRLSDARTPTSHTHTKSEITDFPTIPSCIPLSGTYNITGTDFFKDVNTSSIVISGGHAWNTGAYLGLSGGAKSEDQGTFTLHACKTDGIFYRLIGYPNGTLTWGGNAIVPSTDNGCNLGSTDCQFNAIYAESIQKRHSLDSFYINNNKGAYIILNGSKRQNDPGVFKINAYNGTDRKTMNGYPNGTWTWDGTACQITSDQRLKQQIAEIDNALLDAWQDVEPVQFKYNDAVKEKSDNARLHTGYVVQQIDNACKSHNLDISAYGLYCHEEYPEETEEVEVEQEDGTKTKEKKVIREASEHYSLRYTETLVVECAYLRRENSRLKERLSKIEKLLNI